MLNIIKTAHDSLEQNGNLSKDMALEMIQLIQDLNDKLNRETQKRKELEEKAIPDPVYLENPDQVRTLPDGQYWIYPDDGIYIWMNANRFDQTWVVDGEEDWDRWTNPNLVGSWVVGPIPKIEIPRKI